MAFTAADVKALRESTGAGMMDCKNALANSNGDMEKAMEKWKEALKLAPENKVLIRKIKLKK